MKPRKPPPSTAIVKAPGAQLAQRQGPAKLEEDPFTVYLASLASEASRRSMRSVLDRAAKIFDAFDRSISEDQSDATAATYPWAGGLTAAKVQAAVALVASERRGGSRGPRKIPAARLMCAGLRGLARAAFQLRLLDMEERMRIDDVSAPSLSGKTRGRRLTDDEIDRLFAVCAADESPFGRRDAAILAIMLGTGLRRFEIAALDLGDYHRPAKVGRDPVVFVVREGKGGKHADDVVGAPDVAFAVEDWLQVRGRRPGPLFSSSGGRGRELEVGSRLSASGVYLVCTQRGKEARPVVALAPHDLRRTAITRFLERTGDLALAKAFARHSDPRTTIRYDKRERDALVAALQAARTGYAGR